MSIFPHRAQIPVELFEFSSIVPVKQMCADACEYQSYVGWFSDVV